MRTSGRLGAAADAYQTIKRLILICELRPGAEVREVALAESTGFGRSPVREALGRLVQEGFVEVRPRQGYRVSVITLGSVHEVFELRLMLEPAAVELATRRAPKQALIDLAELAHARYRHGDGDSYERFIVDNREFHVGIANAAGNRRLAHVLRTLLEEMQRLFFLSLDVDDTARQQMREHHDLYDALLAGDSSLACAIAIEQIEESRRRVLEALVAQVIDGTTSERITTEMHPRSALLTSRLVAMTVNFQARHKAASDTEVPHRDNPPHVAPSGSGRSYV